MPDLDLPTPGTTSGPEWASRLNAEIEKINAVVDDSAAAIGGRLALGASNTFDVTNFGATGTGASSDSAAIASVIEMAPFGSTIYFPPGKTFLLSQPIANDPGGVPKSLHFDARGANFVRDGNTIAVRLRAKFEEPIQVSALTTGRISENDNNSIVDTITLTVSSAPAWNRGDVVKLVADDGVPNTFNGNYDGNVTRPRVGQHLTVVSSVGTSIVLAGDPLYTYTTNIRVARMVQAPCTWTGGTFDVTDAHLANGYEQSTIQCEGTYLTTIRGINVKRSSSAAVSLSGCYGTTVDNIRAGWALNWPNSGHVAYGYGVSDSGSQATIISDSRFSQVRHAFTSGAPYRPVNDQIHFYGCTYQVVITNCIAEACTSSGWDTHEGARDVKFDNVIATGCTFGFGNRGIDVVMSNVTTRDCDIGIRTFDAGGESRAFGHVIDGWNSINDKDGYAAEIGEKSGAANYHVVETIPTTISNAVIRVRPGSGGQALSFKWGTFVVRGVTVFHSGAQVYPAVAIRSASVQLADSVFDYSSATGTATSAVSLSNNGVTPSLHSTGGLFFRGVLSGRLTNLVDNSGSDDIRVSGVVLQTEVASALSNRPTNSAYLDYHVHGTGRRSGYSLLGASDLFDGFSRRGTLVAEFILTAARTYPALTVPQMRGQRLTFTNSPTSSANLVVQHGAAFRTNMTSGESVTLTPGRSISFVGLSTGIWQQA